MSACCSTAEWGAAEWAVYEKVRAFVADAADVDLEQVTPDVDIFQQLKVDSLGLVLVLINLEDAFGVPEPEDLKEVGPQLSTPAAIVRFAIQAAGPMA